MLLPLFAETCTANFCTCLSTMIYSFLFGYSPDNKFSLQTNPEPEAYDFIVVGAGAAGCVVANRLSEINDWKILLLEAGKEEPLRATIPAYAGSLGDTEFDWKYKTQPEKSAIGRNKQVKWPRGKIMGGSSAVNAMYYVRGSKEDFNNWERMGNPGWSYEQVLPYFIKSENNLDNKVVEANPDYHGTGGYLSVESFPYLTEPGKIALNAFQERGYKLLDVNAADQLGVAVTQMTAGNNSRSSTNIAFIRPIRAERKNLFVKSQALATKIIIDQKTNRATGIEYTSLKTGKTHKVSAKKEIIISGGVVNSPQLLMVSGIGPSDELRKHKIKVIKDLPVGKNLHDHVSAPGLSAKRQIKPKVPLTCENRLGHLFTYLATRKGPLSAISTVMLTGFAKTKYVENDYPDIQYTFDKLDDDEIAFKPILVTPKSRGYLALNVTDPVRGAPLLYPGYFTEEDDLDQLIAGIGLTIDILNSTVMRQNKFIFNDKPLPSCQRFKFNTYKYWVCFLQSKFNTDFHPVGTCKMGPEKDPTAVVDSRLKVHGIVGLRVIDASIMPTVTRGNTNAPSIMIGEKGSDLVKDDYSLE
ncbi:glucose dehydrogenase [FAD, quinone]-like [Leptopilina heterotoma]|uniref:glucose dehydrogenase [FAD, quinone]-like n=1 Tax=Leptopilina heterotoma TaxID=63436 RepID=UPI001CA7E88B|nr:glucose dehydrogenase [FAD, quinone]-like [Leptopilina heterotoma]